MTKLVQSAVIRTNSEKGSICKITIEAVTFEALWKSYPSERPSQERHKEDIKDKNGKVIAKKGDLLYSDQCAIKVSVAIHGVGVEMKSFNGKGVTRINGKKAALRAEELAAWLKTMPFCGLPTKPEAVTGEDWQTKVKGRTGIVFFANYWTRSGESSANRSGDHIDLWNGSRLTAAGASTLSTIGRYIGVSSLFPGTNFGYSDLAGSSEILFWEIK